MWTSSKNSCFLAKEGDLLKHLSELATGSVNASLIGMPFSAIIFREFIELDTRFTYFNGDLPIGAERRYFIKDGNVVCHHPYWDEDVFRSTRDKFRRLSVFSDDKSLRSIVSGEVASMYDYPEETIRELNYESDDEIETLTNLSLKVGKQFKGYWSVDFARDKKGIWWLIDMALGDSSWHPPH